MKHTILSGSSRKNSTSLLVSKALAKNLQEQGQEQVRILDFESYDLPFFNQELNKNNLSPFQTQLIEAMNWADNIIFVTPEYNWFPSAEIIQLIHRFGSKEYEEIWQNKVFSFVGVSSGRGGRMPMVQLGYVVDKILSVFNFQSITNPKSFEVQFAGKVLDAEGNSLGSVEFDKGLSAFISHHIQLAKRWHLP